MFFQEFLIILLRFAKELHHRRLVGEFNLFSRPHPEIL